MRTKFVYSAIILILSQGLAYVTPQDAARMGYPVTRREIRQSNPASAETSSSPGRPDNSHSDTISPDNAGTLPPRQSSPPTESGSQFE